MRNRDGNLIYNHDGSFECYLKHNGDNANCGLPQWFFNMDCIELAVKGDNVYCTHHSQGSPLPDLKIENGIFMGRNELWHIANEWHEENYGV